MCLLWWVILMQEVGGDSIQVISNHYVCEKNILLAITQLK